MMHIKSDFSDVEVFSFLHKSFQSLYSTHGGEKQSLPSGLMQTGMVRIETPIGVPLISYAKRVIEIAEISSSATEIPMAYFYLRGFCKTPTASMERISEIVVHSSISKNAPLGRFSGPVLMQAPDQHPHKVAMVITSVLRDLGRVLQCHHPEVRPDAIQRFVFCATGSE